MGAPPIRPQPVMSEDPSAPRAVSQYLPPHTLAVVGAAFAIGVLLFAVLWFNGRQKNFYRADGQPVVELDVALAPLPAPLAAGQGASDMPSARAADADGERPHLVEAPAAAAPAAVAEQAAQPAAAPVAAPATDAAQDAPPQRIAEQSPAPEYPASALRGGVRGTVVLNVQVDASGRPTDVSFASRSGSRALDRAAMRAVEGWRFRPALSGGQPVAGEVQIPIEFNP
jgi:protein TonB